MWKIHLKKKNFQIAASFAKVSHRVYSKNDTQRSIIYAEEGNIHMESKNYNAAAASFVKCSLLSIEDVALKFSKLKEWRSLLIYLLKKIPLLDSVIILFKY